MATELGQAYVQIVPSAKGISGAIQKELDPEASSAGKSAGMKLGTGLKLAAAAGFTAAAAGLTKIISSSISEGAELQQSLGGIETLFKGSADKMKQFANDAYKTVGLSANDYMTTVTSFSASLLQSMGGDTEQAADKANMAMIDMGDNANKMGTSMEDIQNAYMGFAKQNYTMLDNLKLGYGGTKTEMERLLADATKFSGVEYNIDSLGDVYDAIHVVQKELGIAGTTAKEAEETFSGSFAAMKASMSNVLGGLALGQDITPALNSLAETTSTFLFGNFFPMVGNILKALPGAISTFIQAAAPTFMQQGMNLLTQITSGVTTGIPNFLLSFQGIITSITTWLTENLPGFLAMGVQILTNIANGIFQSLPQLITVVGNLLSTFVTFLMENIPVILESGKTLLLNLVDGIISNLPAVGDSAIQAISKFIDTIVANYPQYIQSGWNILRSLVQGILERLPDLITAAFTLITKFVAMLISKIPDIVSSGIKLLLGLVKGILQSIPDLLSAAGKIGSTLLDEVSKIDLLGAGKAIIDGFLSGLKSSWGAVKDFVGGIADWIKEHKGPIEYDRKLLVPAGGAIMGGLDESMKDGFRKVQGNVSGMADKLRANFGTEDFSLGDITRNVQMKNSAKAMDNSSNSDRLLEAVVGVLYQILDKDTDVLLDGDSIVNKVGSKMSAKLEELNNQAAGKRGFRRGMVH